jgi:hypothetical protein
LVWSIGKNTIQNNRKGRNLIFATRSFRIATIGVAIFTLLMLSLSTTLKIEPQKIDINSINKSSINELNSLKISKIYLTKCMQNKKLSTLFNTCLLAFNELNYESFFSAII